MLRSFMKLIKYMNDKQLLRWHLEGGVDEAILNFPVNRLSSVAKKDIKVKSEAVLGQSLMAINNVLPNNSSPSNQSNISVSVPTDSYDPSLSLAPALSSRGGSSYGDQSVALRIAQNAKTIEELHKALENFDGCALKKTATNLVFIDGNTNANIIFIGEGPGSEEDRIGLPFVGPSGKLLDKMLVSIGLDRKKVLIFNTVFWRPPGNRTPTSQETAICFPFVERLIQLVSPKIIVALGGSSAKVLLADSASIGRLRGRWFSYSTPGLSTPIETTAMFHPAYLLRTPAQKRDTWKDLQTIKRKLAEH